MKLPLETFDLGFVLVNLSIQPSDVKVRFSKLVLHGLHLDFDIVPLQLV